MNNNYNNHANNGVNKKAELARIEHYCNDVRKFYLAYLNELKTTPTYDEDQVSQEQKDCVVQSYKRCIKNREFGLYFVQLLIQVEEGEGGGEEGEGGVDDSNILSGLKEMRNYLCKIGKLVIAAHTKWEGLDITDVGEDSMVDILQMIINAGNSLVES